MKTCSISDRAGQNTLEELWHHGRPERGEWHWGKNGIWEEVGRKKEEEEDGQSGKGQPAGHTREAPLLHEVPEEG